MRVNMIPINCPTGSAIAPISLSTGQSLVLGRTHQSDIRLPNDRSLSSRHIQLSCDSESVSLLDLGSRNGSFVNGEKVSQVKLSHNDKIQLGSYVFRVDLGEAPDGVADNQVELDSAPPPVIVPGSTIRALKAEANPIGSHLLMLEYELPNGQFKSITVPRDQMVSIGKGSMADYQVECRELSQLHFRLKVTSQSATVEDLDSRHGTFINDQPIQKSELRDGDWIGAGEIKFHVRLPNQRPEAPAPLEFDNKSTPSPVETQKPDIPGIASPLPSATKKRQSNKKIRASAKRTTDTGLIAVDGNFNTTPLDQLIEFCQDVLGGFKLLVDYQRLDKDVPEELKSQAQLSSLWHGPIEKNFPTTALTQFRSVDEAVVAYENSSGKDSMIGIVTDQSVTETAERMQAFGGVWSLGWTGLVRTTCEWGDIKTVQPVFESLTGVVVEGEDPGKWILFLRPEMDQQVLELIQDR